MLSSRQYDVDGSQQSARLVATMQMASVDRDKLNFWSLSAHVEKRFLRATDFQAGSRGLICYCILSL